MKNFNNIPNLKWFLGALFFLTFFSLYIAYTKTNQDVSLVKKDILPSQDQTLIFVNEPQKQIRLIGDIYPSSVEILIKILTENTDIKEVSVDTAGGDVKSALRIAKILKTKDLMLIVNGKCFSACALFLFPSAPRKKIMPQSLVAIHGFRYWINKGSTRQEIQTNELPGMSSSVAQAQPYIEYKKIVEDLNEFYFLSKINVSYIKSFNDFLSRKNSYFLTLRKTVDDVKNCPDIEFWSMDQRKLEEFGVRGIVFAWYPNNAQEKDELFKKLNLESIKFFWGGKEEIDDFCP